jgi:hypothetical protein
MAEVVRAAIKRQNSFEKQDIIHRDTMFHQLTLDITLVWKPLCFSIVTTIYFRERSVRVMDFSTRRGSTVWLVCTKTANFDSNDIFVTLSY